MSDRVYIFSDEAGDFTFKDKAGASRFFIIGSVTLTDCSVGEQLLELRRELAWEGISLEMFHATADKQDVRDRVYELLSACDLRIDATILDKRKAQPHLAANHARFYKTAMFYHFKHVVPRVTRQGDSLAVVASALQLKKKKGALQEAVHDVVEQVARERKYITSFTAAKTDPCLQVADYATWAIQRKFERDDDRSFRLIEGQIASCFELWKYGSTTYY